MNYFCDCENCKNACWGTSGDGWNEPMETEFSCKMDGELDESAEYTDNKDDELCPKFIEIGKIKSVKDLANEVGVEVEGIERAIYKGTDCGAWINLKVDCVETGSIVEGVEQCTQTYTLEYPFSAEEFWSALECVEHEADEIWNDTHGCPYCGSGITKEQYEAIKGTGQDEFDDDMEECRAIDPNCKVCGGEGTIL